MLITSWSVEHFLLIIFQQLLRFVQFLGNSFLELSFVDFVHFLVLLCVFCVFVRCLLSLFLLVLYRMLGDEHIFSLGVFHNPWIIQFSLDFLIGFQVLSSAF